VENDSFEKFTVYQQQQNKIEPNFAFYTQVFANCILQILFKYLM